MDPRLPPEGGHRQAGIVGQGPAAAGQGHGGGLQAGVLSKGGARFLHLQALRLGPDLQGQIRQEGGEFADLAGVAAGDHQGCGGASHQMPSASFRAQSSTWATRSAVGASQ